jgi:hypothetical protein
MIASISPLTQHNSDEEEMIHSSPIGTTSTFQA